MESYDIYATWQRGKEGEEWTETEFIGNADVDEEDMPDEIEINGFVYTLDM